MTNVHFSSARDDWETPQAFFNNLDSIHHFTIDVAASLTNAKCPKFYTRSDDGLSKSWQGETVWCNPPYGREIKAWVEKAFEESQTGGAKVVMLLPSRTDTGWFHEYCLKGEIEFLRGRIKFEGAAHSAPFPSMIVIFGGENAGRI